MDLQQEDVNVKNEESLKTLARAIALSEGQFSLILARCNYESLRQCLMEKLRERCSVELKEISLNPSAKTLYTTIHAALGNEQPSAVIISGLEAVHNLDDMLVASNHARDEFRKHFSFPLVLWVTDDVLQLFIRVAPDFTSWAATPIGFTISTTDLIKSLQKSAESVFAAILKTGSGMFLDNTALNMAIGSQRRLELESVVKDLQHQGEVLEPELEANLQFLLGRDADANGQMQESRQYYERSLVFWLEQLRMQGLQEAQSNELSPSENPNFKIPTSKLVECAGCLLFYLGLWWRRYGTQHRSEYRFACNQARDYFQKCIGIFELGNRPDLMAKFINPWGEVLQRLKAWDELEAVAKLAVRLHETYPEPIRLAYGYGLLADLALSKGAYRIAEQFADLALQTNAESSELACDLEHQYIDCGWSRPHYQNLYLLLMAQAKQHLGQVREALQLLEVAKAESNPQYDPSLYIRILDTLRSLYFDQGCYLEAFWIKQEQGSVEYKYGFRAFIGAGQLQPRCQVINPEIAPVDNLAVVAQEIAASGRQQDINRLIERISRTDCKLTVIHGPSGVGKSSLVTAGLIPALKQRAIGDRDALPIVLRVYTNWVNNLGQSLLRDLGISLANALSEVRDISLPVPDNSPEFILRQLRKNADRNLLTVLVFDQIEEFFFVYTDQGTRCRLYSFLRDCLEIPFVKVILSLREDYLHYLLECERCTNLDIINNDILDKKIRYYLGNFSPEDAKAVIQNLNERSQFYLESALIEQLVQDLAGDTGEVRPIELQVVGAQLHAEEIVTLQQYQGLGSDPKQKLVERFLREAVKDCGPPNTQAALQVLYLLTDENHTRPIKTRAELAAGLENVDVESKEKQLDLVLEILTKSGLLLLLPEAPADRYQLVHDYLVLFIRQQKKESESGLEAALQRERNQRELTEKQLNRVSRQRQQLTVAGIAVALFAVLTTGLALFAHSQRKRAEIAEIKALSSLSSALLLSDDQLGALVESVKVGQRFKELETGLAASSFGRPAISSDIRLRTLGSLQQAVYRVQEFNRLEYHNRTVNSVSFSPDGKLIASASDDNTIKLWDFGKTSPTTLTGHTGIVNSVSFSSDGKFIVSASNDKTVKLWRRDGTLLRTLTGHQGWVKSVSLSPDGKLIASASNDKTIKLWRLDGTLLKTFTGHTDWVNSVSFSPDSSAIASASTDRTVKLWKIDGTLLKTLTGHTDAVNSVSFSPDGNFIVSGSTDKTINLWVTNGTLLKTLTGHTDTVNSVSFSHDGKTIASASADQSIKLWNTEGELLQSLQGHTNWVNSVTFSPNDQIIASASADNTIKLWKVKNLQLQTLQGHRDSVNSVSFSPNGKLIASGSTDQTVKLWNTQGKLLRTLTGHQGVINSVSFSPDGQTIASASADRTIRLWSIDGKLLQTLTDHKNWVNSVTFSPDGQTIASASADSTIKLWSINGKLLKTLTDHKDWVNSVTFSPDGQMIASASNDKTVKLWSKDGTLLTTLTSAAGSEGHMSGVNDVNFSPDSQIIASASADNTIKLWNKNGTLRTTLYGHLLRVTSVRFHPDGKTLVSASADNTVKFWSLDGNLLKTIEGHRSSVNSVRFSPDGKFLASASKEKIVILWNFDLDNLLVRGCNWLNDYLENPNANIKPVANRSICDRTPRLTLK